MFKKKSFLQKSSFLVVACPGESAEETGSLLMHLPVWLVGLPYLLWRQNTFVFTWIIHNSRLNFVPFVNSEFALGFPRWLTMAFIAWSWILGIVIKSLWFCIYYLLICVCDLFNVLPLGDSSYAFKMNWKVAIPYIECQIKSTQPI